MHELDIIDKILTIIAREAKRSGIGRVREATLAVGRMNGLEQHHFDSALAARNDDSLTDTSLTINEVPVQLVCNYCGNPFEDKRFDDPHFAHSTSHAPHLYLSPPCPECNKEGATIASGKEMRLLSIEGD